MEVGSSRTRKEGSISIARAKAKPLELPSAELRRKAVQVFLINSVALQIIAQSLPGIRQMEQAVRLPHTVDQPQLGD